MIAAAQLDRFEPALRDAEAPTAFALDSLRAQIAVLDADGLIVAVNRAWRNFAQANGAPESARHSVGANYLAVCDSAAAYPNGEEAPLVAAGIRTVLAGQQAEFEIEYPCHAPLEKRWFLMYVTALSGTARGAVVSHRNITERKLAEIALLQSESVLRATIESPSGVNIVSVSRDYLYLSFNSFHESSMKKAYGIDVKVGMNLLDCVLDEGERAKAKGALDRAFAGESHLMVEMYGTVEAAHWETRFNPIFDAGRQVIGATAYSLDVTDRVRTQAALLASKNEAEAAYRAKSEFLSRMSHELRTPLNAMVGLTQVLQMSADDQTMGSQRDKLQTMLSAGWQLAKLIDDLMNLSALDSGKVFLDIKDVDVGLCLTGCFELVSPLASRRGLRLGGVSDSWAGVMIRADPLRLKQILVNLLSNAAKYNRDGGSISVMGARSPGLFRILVSDTGEGISEGALPCLFEPFDRLTQRPYTIEGAGIGLAVAKQLTELMGGALGVESVHGKGSTFWIEFPVVEAQTARSLEAGPPSAHSPLRAPAPMVQSARHAPRPGGRHARFSAEVLIVEDNAVNALVARSMLERFGCRVAVAEDGASGVLEISTRRYDLVLMDLNMPGMDGFAAARAVREEERITGRKRTRIVALTADAFASNLGPCLAAGMDGYTVKPFELATLEGLLYKFCPEHLILNKAT